MDTSKITDAKEIWICEECKRVGIIGTDQEATALSEMNIVANSHHKTSPGCDGTTLKSMPIDHLPIRIRIPEWAIEQVADLF